MIINVMRLNYSGKHVLIERVRSLEIKSLQTGTLEKALQGLSVEKNSYVLEVNVPLAVWLPSISLELMETNYITSCLMGVVQIGVTDHVVVLPILTDSNLSLLQQIIYVAKNNRIELAGSITEAIDHSLE